MLLLFLLRLRKATRVRIEEKDGKKSRVAVKCGSELIIEELYEAD